MNRLSCGETKKNRQLLSPQGCKKGSLADRAEVAPLSLWSQGTPVGFTAVLGNAIKASAYLWMNVPSCLKRTFPIGLVGCGTREQLERGPNS